MHNDSKLIFEAFMKNRPADYEDQLDKKEAYKSSLLRKDDLGSETRIGRLEQMGEDFTSNETQQMINNIAQICHTLLTGGGAGSEYSGIKLSNDQLPYIEQIADIVVKMHKGEENSESQITSPEQIGRPEDRMAVAGVRAMGNYLKTLPDPNEAFKQAAQRWMRKNNQFLNLNSVEYFDRNGEPVFKKERGNFD